MIDESAALLPIWMLMSAAFGFIVGDAFGDSTRHGSVSSKPTTIFTNSSRRPAPANAATTGTQRQRGVINDIHKQIAAVTKGLQKRPS